MNNTHEPHKNSHSGKYNFPTRFIGFDQIERLHGLLRGSVVIPPDVDLTEPVLTGEIISGRDRS